jgi:putative AdoMet-dependent methyltransferase
MTDLFPVEDFEGWAESYDQTILDEAHFPFVGYQAALGKVVALANAQPGMSVLDLGTGTGNLAAPFAEIGCDLWCTDFSPSMLEKARQKLPHAQIIQFDLRDTWPAALHRRFDRIVSGYVFHHFELVKKVAIIQKLVRDHLNPGGSVIIADLSFADAAARDVAQQSLGDEWEEEFYWIADETLVALEDLDLTANFHKISFCAGIFHIR